MDWQRVPQAWSSSRKTPVAETVIWTTDDAHRCVGRSESARADVGSKLTVVCQIRRYLTCQGTLEDQDGDLEGHSLTQGPIVSKCSFRCYCHASTTAMRRRLVCLPSSQLNRQQSVMYVAARLVRSAWKFRAHHAALRRLRAPRRNEFKIVPRVFRCPHSTATHQLARELHVAKSTRNGDYVLRRRRRRRSAFHRLVVSPSAIVPSASLPLVYGTACLQTSLEIFKRLRLLACDAWLFWRDTVTFYIFIFIRHNGSKKT